MQQVIQQVFLAAQCGCGYYCGCGDPCEACLIAGYD